jgi:hypothetical protein
MKRPSGSQLLMTLQKVIAVSWKLLWYGVSTPASEWRALVEMSFILYPRAALIIQLILKLVRT